MNSMYTEMTPENRTQLARLISILFWLIIPTIVAATLSGFQTAGAKSDLLSFLNTLLEQGVQLAYGITLIVMGKFHKRYRFAGICLLIPAFLGLLPQLFLPAAGKVLMSTITLLPTMIFSLVAVYYEYRGHSEILASFDPALSQKWERLWKWYIALTIATFIGMLLMMLSFLFALLFLILSLISLVISVLKLVYLYQTVTVLRN